MRTPLRAEARARGDKRYFTGKPCKYGHVAERYVSDAKCAECGRLNLIHQYRADPEKSRRARVERRFRRFTSYLLYLAKRRAGKLGLPFNLTEDDIEIPAVCPVLGIPMVMDGVSTPSIDRLRADQGYVRGNVVVVSTRANKLRNDASIEELRAIVAFYEDKLQPHEHG